MEIIKKRKPIIALILSMLMPGLGHLYNGQIKRGIITYIAGYLFIVVLFAFLYSTFKGLMIFFVLSGIVYLFILFDSFIQAFKIKETILKKYHKWYIYSCIILLNMFLVIPVNIFSISPVRPYRTVSISMLPTLKPGDIFLIDKYWYNIKSPIRGDIIVFKSPMYDKKDYVKRIVGLPGEIIEIIGNTIYINHEAIKHSYSFDENVSPKLNVHSGPYHVPDKSVFVLGDNRNHSYDSRHFKSINHSSFKGKVLYVIWSKSKKKGVK